MGIWTSSLRAKNAALQRDLVVRDNNIEALHDEARVYRSLVSSATSRLLTQVKVTEASLDSLGGLLEQAVRDRDAALVATSSILLVVDSLLEINAAVSEHVTETEVGLVRNVTVEVQGPPVEGTISVGVPSDTAKAIIFNPERDLRLAILPITIRYALSCTPSGVPAVAVETEVWLRPSVTQGLVSQDVCNPLRVTPFIQDLFSFSTGDVVKGSIFAVIGYLLGQAGGG